MLMAPTETSVEREKKRRRRKTKARILKIQSFLTNAQVPVL